MLRGLICGILQEVILQVKKNMPGIILNTPIEYNAYYIGGSYTFKIPEGASYIYGWAQAAGGSGKARNTVDGSAGGGGGFCYFERRVIGTDWNGTLSITVGVGAANTNGGNTTISGTLNGSSISVTAVGGNRGTTLADGTGGSASGGDTNLAGQDAFGFVVGPVGEEAPGFPGEGGGKYNNGSADHFPGIIDANFFAPGCGGFASGPAGLSNDIPGFEGYVILKWV